MFDFWLKNNCAVLYLPWSKFGERIMTQYHSVKLFEEKKIRSSWDAESETWYYSVVDVVGILTDQPDSRRASNYW